MTEQTTEAVGRIAKARRSCSNDWCDRPARKRGFCQACYDRGRYHGDMAHAAMLPGQFIPENDEAAIERLVAGDRPARTTIGEREEAVRRLHAPGLNDGEIAARLGCYLHSAWVIRNRRLGLPPNQLGRVRIVRRTPGSAT